MARKKPNIITPHNGIANANSLVNAVIDDFLIYSHTPDSISLDGELFTLTLSNKKLVYQEVKVDKDKDYFYIYLQGILKDRTAYEIEDNGSDLVITFKEGIALEPGDIVANDFLVRGKIVSR